MVIPEDMEQCRRIRKETESLEKVKLFMVHCKGTEVSLQPTHNLRLTPNFPAIESGKCAKTNSVG